jgi:GGDEF domain-containing protein/HPt (histidine-containing phosphotransfer) domain-containing protein
VDVSGLSPAIQQRLQALAAQFESELPDRIREIREISDLMSDDAPDVDLMASLRLRVHKLAGAAATFGFAEWAGLARQAEHAIDAWQQDGAGTSEHFLLAEQRIDALLAYEDDSRIAAPPGGRPEIGADTELPVLRVGLDTSFASFMGELETELGLGDDQIDRINSFGTVPGDSGSVLRVLIADGSRLATDLAEKESLAELLKSRENIVPLVLMDDFSIHGLDEFPFSSRVRLIPAGFSVRRIARVVQRKYSAALHGSRRMLIAGGEPELADLIGRLLTVSGWSVEHADDAHEIVYRLSTQTYSVVCLAFDETTTQQWLSFLESDEAVVPPAVVVFSGDQHVSLVPYPVITRVSIHEPDFITAMERIAGVAERRLAERFEDPATGLLTASSFDRLLSDEVSRAARGNRELTLAVCTAERTGDSEQRADRNFGALLQLHRLVADCISSQLRKTDMCGVSGPGQFQILLPDTAGQTAEKVLLKLHDRLSIALADSFGSGEVRIAIGAACYPEVDGPTQVRSAATRAVGEIGPGGGVEIVQLTP